MTINQIARTLLPLLLLLAANCFMAQATAQNSSPRKIAFLIGVNDYKKKDLADLNYAENDVTEVARQLKKLGFETKVLTGRNATQADIKRELGSFIKVASDLESNDIVFAMFSGHGQELQALVEKRVIQGDDVTVVKRLETIPYFCARDAIPFDKTRHLLRGKTEQQIADEFNLISLSDLIGRLDQDSNSLRNLLVVDACRNDPSKGMGKAANISGGTVRELPTGLSILFAAKSGQKSWESSDANIKHGVMTHFLIQGLKGEAIDKQGEYTWGDLTNYVKKSVIRNRGKLAGGANRLQNPHSINSDSDVIVLGRLAKVPLLSAPFGKREIEDSISALGRSKGMKPVMTNDIGMEFRLIPAGNFLMGSPKSEKERDADELQHEVEISQPFYMGTYEVTQAEWEEVMGKNPSDFSKSGKYADRVEGLNTSTFPVENVSWEDSQKFIARLNTHYKVSGYLYGLPSEAQWEYACRGGNKMVFHFGNILNGKNANCNGSLRPYGTDSKGPWLTLTCKVGTFNANGFGLYDMHGNVREWCSDWYDSDFYKTSPLLDPTGPKTSSYRVFRGGSWMDVAYFCRSAKRDCFSSTHRGGNIGLRVVLSRQFPSHP